MNRKIKVYTKSRATGTFFNRKINFVPLILLTGKWLENLGFNAGQSINIHCNTNEIIINNTKTNTIMKNIDKLPFVHQKSGSEIKKRLTEFANHHKRFARIYFTIIDIEDGTNIVVKVEQKQDLNGKVLTAKELIDRAHDIFDGEIPEGWKIRVRPIVYKRDDIFEVTPKWIREKMHEHQLKQIDLVKLLDIDKSSISDVLSGRHQLTKWQKTAFYYFFKDL